MTNGEIRMAQLIKNDELKKREKAELELMKNKIFPFANRKICPECGKDLLKPQEVVCFINGEWGDIEFYIDCQSCGCKYSTMNENDKQTAYKHFFKNK
jgi:hypothetical protein